MTSSDQHLYQLYRNLGDALAVRGDRASAADAFALALYYARRMGNQALASECQQMVITNNRRHVAAQQTSAPLHFAQLLMRYPADEAEKKLAELSQAPQPVLSVASSPFEIATTAFSLHTADVEEDAEPSLPIDKQSTQPMINLSQPTVKKEAPVLPFNYRPEIPAPDQLEQHHVFDLGSGEMGARAQSLRLTEEFLHPHTRGTQAPVEDEASELALAIHFAGICAIVVGLISIGFFAVQMYPSLTRKNLERVVKMFIETGAAEESSESLASQETVFEAQLPAPISIETVSHTTGVETTILPTAEPLPPVRIEKVSENPASSVHR